MFFPITAEFTKFSRALVREGTRNCEFSVEGYKIFGLEFFQGDALELAPNFWGKLLHTNYRGVSSLFM